MASLRRGLEQPARVLGRAAFSNSAGVQAAAPALAPSSGKGFLSGLFGGSSRVTVPLTEPLPGVELPTPASAPSSAPQTKQTTLANGVKIASEDTPVSARLGRTVSGLRMPVPRPGRGGPTPTMRAARACQTRGSLAG